MTDTAKSSHITDHPFMPRTGSRYLCAWIYDDAYEPKVCNMAEAAHRETTVKR